MTIKENSSTFLFLTPPHLQFFFSRLASLLQNLWFYSFVTSPSFSLDFHRSHRNWFANVHSELKRQQWGRAGQSAFSAASLLFDLVGTTKRSTCMRIQSASHKETASLIEPASELSIWMGRVNFAKGNWVFLSCLSWGHEQIHEQGWSCFF